MSRKIRIKILDLQDKNCTPCKYLEEYREEQARREREGLPALIYMERCRTKCEVGLRLLELGKELVKGDGTPRKKTEEELEAMAALTKKVCIGYLAKGMPTAEIAERHCMDVSSVNYRIRKWGIRR